MLIICLIKTIKAMKRRVHNIPLYRESMVLRIDKGMIVEDGLGVAYRKHSLGYDGFTRYSDILSIE